MGTGSGGSGSTGSGSEDAGGDNGSVFVEWCIAAPINNTMSRRQPVPTDVDGGLVVAGRTAREKGEEDRADKRSPSERERYGVREGA